MPFWKKSNDRPSKKEIETMQDAKISLAENLPAHVKIIDLSHIYLSELPYGVVSVVKFQNKDCLILKNNELKDLKGDLNSLDELLKLDLSYNHFKHVPKNLASCQSLVHINLDNNELKALPAILGSLKNLETLSACQNHITTIAPEIGALGSLNSFLIRNNDVSKLPDNFAHCYRLVNLEVDLEKITYPPAEVVMQGGRATVLWLCDENNVDPSKVDDSVDTRLTTIADITAQEKAAQEMILKHQANVDQETAEMMAQIREDENNFKKMAEDTNVKEAKRKLKMQKKMEEEDRKEKVKLSEYLKFCDDVKMENIREALKEVEDKDIDAERILAEVTRLHEEEKKHLAAYIEEDEALLKQYVSNHKLDMSFISEEMGKILLEEKMMDAFVENAEQELQKMFSEIKDDEREEKRVHTLMAKEVEKDKTHMLNMILEDEELQRKMFVTAQQNHDKVYKALSIEIENVQENLMLLTVLEKNQKDLDQQVRVNIGEQRAEMAGLLTQLMYKQDERRKELEAATRQIEEQFEDELANFWLYQYQMLMNSKPVKILREEEEAIRAATKAAQIEKPEGDEYRGPDVLPAAWTGPSAPTPSEDGLTPTAPLVTPTKEQKPARAFVRQQSRGEVAAAEEECCICLDKPPAVAFLPCGHVCCCAGCGIVSVCPMCRAGITSTVKLYFTQSL